MGKKRQSDTNSSYLGHRIRSGATQIRHHLSRGADPEYLQGITRLVIVAGMVVFAFSPYLQEHSLPNLLAAGRTAVLLTAALSLSLLLAIVRNVGSPVLRRGLGIVHDTLIVSFGLYLGGDNTAWFAVIYLLIILGNGMRYGVPYLLFSSALSLVGFATASGLSPYWQNNTILATNIFAVLFIVPVYMFSLLRSLHKAKASLEERARYDSLTGLFNRHEMEIQMEALLHETPGGNALLFCDLDFFKAVNDEGGHGAGDTLLKDIGKILQQSARSEDYCARMGGDEFCVLIAQCSRDEALTVAERIRQQVADHILLWGTRKFTVGISIGIALSVDSSTPSTLLQQADAACYQAKNSGRNKIHIFDVSANNVIPERTSTVIPIR